MTWHSASSGGHSTHIAAICCGHVLQDVQVPVLIGTPADRVSATYSRLALQSMIIPFLESVFTPRRQSTLRCRKT